MSMVQGSFSNLWIKREKKERKRASLERRAIDKSLLRITMKQPRKKEEEKNSVAIKGRARSAYARAEGFPRAPAPKFVSILFLKRSS